MASLPTPPETSNESSSLSNLSVLEIREMDVPELLGLPFEQMSDEQKRAILQTCQEIRNSPQTRALKVRRTSDKLAGKARTQRKVEVKLDDLFS